MVKYIDVDNNSSTFNSSSATLTIPNATHIIWAGLYWAGNVHKSDSTNRLGTTTSGSYQTISSVNLSNTSSNYNVHQVLLHTPGMTISPATAYTTITAEQLDTQAYYGTNGGVYNSFADVTSYVKSGGTGEYTIANVETMEGKESGLGNFGAWTMVVIYDSNNYTTTTLKPRNVSIFDGYQAISGNNNVDIPIVGFKTPISGGITASLSTFLEEGEQFYSGDNITFNGKSIPGATNNNIADAQISGGFSRNPTWINNNGIDIDTFDISSLMTNGQTTATIRLTSSQDAYWASMIGFSTQLYIPNICYDQTYVDSSSGNTLGSIATGTNFSIKTTVNNTDQETAQDVIVQVSWDGNIRYTAGTTQIQNVLDVGYTTKTDGTGDDIAEFLSDSNTTRMYLGRTSTSQNGGTIAFGESSKIKAGMLLNTVPTNGILDNIYRVSFYSPTAGVIPLSPMSACSDLNKSISAYAATGAFQAVEHGGSCGGDMNTKIVNQGFNVDIVSCDSSNNLVNNGTSTALTIQYADTNVSTPYTTPSAVSVTFPVNSNRLSNVAISAFPKAIRSVLLKVSKTSGTPSTSNNFAVRPKSFGLDTNTTAGVLIKAGNSFTFNFKGLNASGQASVDYNETVGGSFQVTVKDRNETNGCASGAFVPAISNGWNFLNGANNVSTYYPEVGIIDINVSDKALPCNQRFAAVDCTDANTSAVSIDDNVTTLTFIPDHFTIVPTLTNANAPGFTYLSTDNAMSATLNMDVTAMNQYENNTSNYNNNCYSKITNYSISYQPLGITPASGLTTLNYLETNTTRTGTAASTATSFTMLSMPKTIFGNVDKGKAHLFLSLNFDRNQTLPVNPFSFVLNTLDVNDTDNALGHLVVDPTVADTNATFVYGRFIPRDIRVFGGDVVYSANAWYEVYNAPTLAGTALSPSRNDAMWYSNSLHNDTIGGDGNITYINEQDVNKGGVSVLGMETYTFDAIGVTNVPYSAKAHILTSSWLWYGATALGYEDPTGSNNCLTHPCFNISIVPPIGSSGSMKTATTNSSTNSKASKLTTVSSGLVYDYAPATR